MAVNGKIELAILNVKYRHAKSVNICWNFITESDIILGYNFNLKGK
jgi:hypothetical protein